MVGCQAEREETTTGEKRMLSEPRSCWVLEKERERRVKSSELDIRKTKIPEVTKTKNML